MSKSALMPVEFHGSTLSLVSINNKPFFAVKPVCDAIGLTWQGQLERIKRNPVLESTISVTLTVGEDGKTREMVSLPLSMLNGWLFGINANRVKNPEIRQKLIAYQFECFDVLNTYWNGKTVSQEKTDVNALIGEIDKSVQMLISFDVASGKRHVCILDEHIKIVDTRSESQVVQFVSNLECSRYAMILDFLVHYFKQCEEDYQRQQGDLHPSQSMQKGALCTSQSR